MNIPQLDSTYIANTYARFPVTIARGKGSLVWDADDKVYIDMATGIAVNSFGIADPAWIRAVTEQLCTVQHASNLYYTAPDAQLAQLLCEKTGMKKVFFSNSGAEANECAIKAARKYAADHKGPEYHTIITLKNSFHGRTITTLAATGQDVFHHDFLPLTEGFAYAEANNLDDLKAQVAAHKCAAIMMEVVQGEGGVIPLTQEFVKGAAHLGAEQAQLGGAGVGELEVVHADDAHAAGVHDLLVEDVPGNEDLVGLQVREANLDGGHLEVDFLLVVRVHVLAPGDHEGRATRALEGKARDAREDLARGNAEVRDAADLLAISGVDRVSHELGEIDHLCS